MTPYQEAGQLALGREKVDATRDIAGAKNQVAQENAKTKEQLAAIHNLPDSEKYKMLLDGRITVENLKDAAAASRETEQGNIDIRKIDETGRLKTGQIEQQKVILIFVISVLVVLKPELLKVLHLLMLGCYCKSTQPTGSKC